jgi:hypothetical protein
MRAACAGFRDEAIPAGVTRAMNVQERNLISFAESLAFNIE